MKMKFLGVLLLLLMALAQSALAKGPPQKVTISGGDLATEIEITGDTGILDALQMMSFEDYTTLTRDAPEGSESWGDGYLITRYYEDPPGRYFAFDQLRYYPDPDGGRGYIFYVGIVNGSSEYDGKWFRASETGDAALNSVLAGTQGESLAATSSILDLFLNALAAFVGAH